MAVSTGRKLELQPYALFKDSKTSTRGRSTRSAVNSRFPALGKGGGRRSLNKFCSWNVQTLRTDKVLTPIVLMLGQKDIDFCSLQEFRRPKAGSVEINVPFQKKIFSYTLNYSGTPGGGLHGVGILVKTTKLKFLKSSRTKSFGFSKIFPERLMWLIFEGVTIVSVYGFTECGSKTVSKVDHWLRRASLYAEFSRVYDSLSHSQPVIIGGDFNARIGFRGNSELLVGQHGNRHERKQNTNGNFLMDFAEKHYMCFPATFFQKGRYSFSSSWRSQAFKNRKAALNYFLLHQRWKRSVVACWYGPFTKFSDHRPMFLNFKMRFHKPKKQPEKKPQWLRRIVKDKEILADFAVKASNMEFLDEDISKHDGAQLNCYWRKMLTEIKEATAEFSLLKFNKVNSSDSSCIAFDDTLKMWASNKNSKVFKKKTRAAFQRDYGEQWKKIGVKMEKASAGNDIKELYSLMKTHLGTRAKPIEADANDFAEMLRKTTAKADHEIPRLEATSMNEEELPAPTFEDIQKVVKSMKKDKAAGDDAIPMEIWSIPALTKKLFELITAVWKTRKAPTAWKNAVVIPIAKKKKNSYRPVSLLVTAYKVYVKWLLIRLKPAILLATGDTQAGFLEGRSTLDNISYIHRWRERALHFNQERWFIFSDVKSAFDTVSRNAVLNVLQNCNVNRHLLELVEDSMTATKGMVRTREEESQWFDFQNGLFQGSVLSPGLFVAALGAAVTLAARAKAKSAAGSNFDHREYADDLFNSCFRKQNVLPCLRFNAYGLKCIGSKLEHCKTELYHIAKDGTETIYKARDDIVDIKPTDDKKSLKYLADQLGPAINAINTRMSKARQVYGRFYFKVWSRDYLSIRTKVRIFNANVISVMLYALKTHAITEYQMKKLNVFALWKLKSILNYPYDAQVSYNRMTADLALFKIDWVWPADRLRKQRLDYFMQFISKPELRKSVPIHPEPYEHNREKANTAWKMQ